MMHNECRNPFHIVPQRRSASPGACWQVGPPDGAPECGGGATRTAVDAARTGILDESLSIRAWLLNIDGYSGSRPGHVPDSGPPPQPEVPATMFPATWIERFPDVPFFGRLRAWLEPGRSSIPEFGEISFGLWRPTLDICEALREFVIRVELPGLEPSQVRVTCDRGVLTIAGTREEIREQEEIDFPLRERTFGSFSRSIQLPAEANDGDVRTAFANGLLVVRVGKQSLGTGLGGWAHRSVS